MRAVTARRKLATAVPLGVNRRSGSSVRLPLRVTWVSAIADALLGARAAGWLVGWLVAMVVRAEGGLTSLWPVLVDGGGEQGAGDAQAKEQADQGDNQAAASPHGVLLSGGSVVPAGRAQVLARPGRPGLSGPPRHRSGQGTARRAERALRSAQRPLTAQVARWQPVQQATGRSACGRRVPARGAAGEAGPCPGPPWWEWVELPVGWWWPGLADRTWNQPPADRSNWFSKPSRRVPAGWTPPPCRPPRGATASLS